MGKVSFQTSFKNEHKASYLAREIARYFNRGTALENRIETVLNHLREWTSTRSLKQLDSQRIEAFVQTLKDKVANQEISRKTTENYISALNRIIEYTNFRLDKNLETISPKQYELSRGAFVYVDRAVSQETHEKFLSFLSEKGDIRAQALMHSVILQREFGLRLRESLAIKQSTIERALETRVLHLGREDGTKSGRERNIEIWRESQYEALKNTLDFMKENNLTSLIPCETLREQYNFAYNVMKEFNEKYGNFHYHGERHAFAQESHKEQRSLEEIRNDLGHGRSEIVKVYVK